MTTFFHADRILEDVVADGTYATVRRFGCEDFYW
jgi:hypothetical protein